MEEGNRWRIIRDSERGNGARSTQQQVEVRYGSSTQKVCRECEKTWIYTIHTLYNLCASLNILYMHWIKFFFFQLHHNLLIFFFIFFLTSFSTCTTGKIVGSKPHHKHIITRSNIIIQIPTGFKTMAKLPKYLALKLTLWATCGATTWLTHWGICLCFAYNS